MIGVIGSGKGVGVTHLSILLSNYLAGARRKRVALVEWNQSGDFERIYRFCCRQAGRVKGFPPGAQGKPIFSLLGVAYFGNADEETLAACLKGAFEEVVLDFGCGIEKKGADFLRCQKKVLVGSFSEWQQEEFLRILAENPQAQRENWKVAVNFGSEESEKEVLSRMRVNVIRIPFWPDAFCVAGEMFRFLEDFIK